LNLLFHHKGDEVLSVNGVVMQGLSHSQAIKLFKEVRGPMSLYLARRGHERMVAPLGGQERGFRRGVSQSCEALDALAA